VRIVGAMSRARDLLMEMVDRATGTTYDERRACAWCQAEIEPTLYGQAFTTPEQVVDRQDTWCRRHKGYIAEVFAAIAKKSRDQSR